MPPDTLERVQIAGKPSAEQPQIFRQLDSTSPRVNFVLVLLIGVALLARLHLTWVFEINWDEFRHLSQIYQHERGGLTFTLQSIYVHLFGWLPLVGTSEVDQIIAARVAIFVLTLGTAVCLFLISRRFLPVSAALLAVLCYLSFSFVLRQGNSFRTDPIATSLLMGALWLMICGSAKLRFAIVSGVLIGLAGMVTIKSVLYVPTMALVLLIGLLGAENRRQRLRYGFAVAGSAALSFAAFYLLHRLTLGEAVSPVAMVEGAASKTLGERDFTNAIMTFRGAVIENTFFWLLMAIGLGVCLLGLIRSRGREKRSWGILLSCGLLLGSLFVYTNSFAYFYPFMLAPAAVLCGASLLAFPERLRVAVALVLGLGIAGSTTVNYASALDRGSSAQRQTLEAVHRLFPEPTPYIDRCSMVSAYPKKGFFMSVWGMSIYYRAGTPVMRAILEQDQPRFLLANRRMLELDDLGPDEHGPRHFGLFKEDLAVLKANFVHHWGVIYVAGKRLSLPGDGSDRTFEILVEGTYTVESPVAVTVDGVRREPGDTLTLEQGSHTIRAAGEAEEVVLRWGDHLYRPDEPAPKAPLFTGF
jgi:hypothetical protein